MYRMTSHTFQALEEHHRRQFCRTCLQDLQADGFPTDPEDDNELELLVSISKQIETSQLVSESLQFRYFMAYYLFGHAFLMDNSILDSLEQLDTEEARRDYLELLIKFNS